MIDGPDIGESLTVYWCTDALRALHSEEKSQMLLNTHKHKHFQFFFFLKKIVYTDVVQEINTIVKQRAVTIETEKGLKFEGF